MANNSNKNKQDDVIRSVRLDKWLWATRFYKTRQLAVSAIKNGKITMEGLRAKPAASVKTGFTIEIKRGIYLQTVTVLKLIEQRGSATIAQACYQESEASVQKRQQTKQQLAYQPKLVPAKQKPDQRGVRQARAIKRGERE